jgi:hypothetical protein
MENYEKSDIKNYKINAQFTIPNALPTIHYNENLDRKALGLDSYKRMTMLQDIKKEDLESRIKKDKN